MKILYARLYSQQAAGMHFIESEGEQMGTEPMVQLAQVECNPLFCIIFSEVFQCQ